jgi:hypothetical protein
MRHAVHHLDLKLDLLPLVLLQRRWRRDDDLLLHGRLLFRGGECSSYFGGRALALKKTCSGVRR